MHLNGANSTDNHRNIRIMLEISVTLKICPSISMAANVSTWKNYLPNHNGTDMHIIFIVILCE